MEAALTAVRQTMVMFLYMLAGWCLFQCGKLSEKGSKDMASLLVWLVIPAVIVNSFCTECTAEKLAALGSSTLLAVVSLGVAILISRLVFPKKPIENFGASFSNAGFMGIPLVKAMLGNEAVFYLVAIIALLNILQGTYGVSVLTGGRKKPDLYSVLKNPILVGAVIGLVLFFTGLGSRMPTVVAAAVSGIAALNAPLAMLVLGVYMAKNPLISLFTSKGSYYVSLWRLVLIPAVTLLIFTVLPVDGTVKMAVLLAAAAPIGANVAVYAQLNDLDYSYACQTVALSTALSIVTLPLISLAGTILFTT